MRAKFLERPRDLRRDVYTDQSSDKNNRGHQKSGKCILPLHVDQERLKSHEHKEEDIEHIVDDLPERVEVMARHLRHAVLSAIIADKETGNDDRERTGHMNERCEYITSRNERERE